MQGFDREPHFTTSADTPVTEGGRIETLISHAISSARLLLGRPSVTIDHEGTLYVLRATRAGKLILTK